MLGWADKPNIEGVHVQKEWKTQIRINSKGLRDQDYDYKKPEGINRIVVLGDSFTWGYGVEEYERFTEVLEDTLLENCQVINTGVCGYGNDQQLLFLKNEGVKYNPDLVVVAFFVGNDILNNLGNINKPLFVLNEDIKLILTNVPVPRKGEDNDDNVKEIVTVFLSFNRFMAHHSHAYVFIADRIVSSPNLLNLFKKIGIVDVSLMTSRSYGFYGFNHYNWNLTKAILREIDAVAKTNNAKTMIVIIPTRILVNKNWDSEINGALVDFGKENNIAVLDLFPEFREHAKNGEQLYFKMDGHWNANGHKLAAELIYDKLIEEQLISLGGEH
jgi:lysophospholipase L1-like esterase